jgi:peroxin-19
MLQMQACGQPPEEIVQDLAPGLAFGADGLPQLPTGARDKCVIA